MDWASGAAGADAAGQPPWVALGLAAIATAGVIATAYGPVLVERARSRSTARTEPESGGQPDPAPPPAPPPIPPQDSIDLIEDAVADYRRQRDQAIDRADRLQEQLDEARREIARRDVHIARLEARGSRYG